MGQSRPKFCVLYAPPVLVVPTNMSYALRCREGLRSQVSAIQLIPRYWNTRLPSRRPQEANHNQQANDQKAFSLSKRSNTDNCASQMLRDFDRDFNAMKAYNSLEKEPKKPDIPIQVPEFF